MIFKNKDDSTTLLLLDTKNNYIELVIPVVGIVALAALFTIIAVKKSKAIEVAR